MINRGQQNIIFLIKLKIEKKRFYIFTKKKIIILFILLTCMLKNNSIRLKINYELDKNYKNIQRDINFTFHNKLKSKIRFGIYIYKLKGGGAQRVTALLLNYIQDYSIFDIFLFTLNIIEEDEYKIPDKIKRIFLKNGNINNLIKEIKKKKINILLYQFPHFYDIHLLNGIKSIKTIFYRHSSIFYWIYDNLQVIKNTYREYFNSKYIISLIPLENDYILHKWGIRTSILMDNFITYEYSSIIPSDLSSNTIIMIGRADDIYKRYYLGILAMEYLVKDFREIKMKIISRLDKTEYLKDLIYNLNLENSIHFVGFSTNPEIYFQNSSLHLLPTLTETFSQVLCETKIYGIPTILLGLDYLTLSKEGTIIIYDEIPDVLAKESLKLMEDKQYRKIIGKKARISMKRFNNMFLYKKWIKLLLSAYNSYNYYQILQNNDVKLSNKTSLKLLKNQIKLIKKRKLIYSNLTIDDFLNYNYWINYNYSF